MSAEGFSCGGFSSAATIIGQQNRIEAVQSLRKCEEPERWSKPGEEIRAAFQNNLKGRPDARASSWWAHSLKAQENAYRRSAYGRRNEGDAKVFEMPRIGRDNR
jgi:hypothetical protein